MYICVCMSMYVYVCGEMRRCSGLATYGAERDNYIVSALREFDCLQ